MVTRQPPATPRRKPAARPGHQEQKSLLTIGALCAVLGGWLILAREPLPAPPTATLLPGSAAVSTTLPRTSGATSQVAVPARPQPITQTRSSR